MTDDPYKVPVAIPDEQSKPPRVVVFALLAIIAIAAAVGIQNYRRRALMREAAIQAQMRSNARAEKARQATQAAEENSSQSP